ncbi:RNA polymerase, sigma-24 subunit, ECF subfamily protein [Planococcus donghaensis MPA1U2]|uniref:RNA polymerase, sigma-24 subunit, ECF subfamily protein n=1 Tax=Planococcus donghaensis MPA1U2 TaxID=933115 RepID=E7RF37_9BACL|nr:RNA polymerase sigma factor [Planococcus donghaensis]EGA90436.1 RNA polymerase, sigma-24 subunit, ECF subfamily protein [Planococcus donghaensis MPA1U2]
MEKSTDTSLYLRVNKQDKDALEELYDRYEKILFSFLYKMLEDKGLAEEALQEVFIKIWRGKGVYDESKGKFSSWLFRMAQNTAIDLIRKRKKPTVPIEEASQMVSNDEPVEEQVVWQEKKTQIEMAVQHLSAEQQKMIDLFYFKGHTHETIADMCDIPLGTVKSRIRLALKKLKTSLHGMQERGAYDD